MAKAEGGDLRIFGLTRIHSLCCVAQPSPSWPWPACLLIILVCNNMSTGEKSSTNKLKGGILPHV